MVGWFMAGRLATGGAEVSSFNSDSLASGRSRPSIDGPLIIGRLIVGSLGIGRLMTGVCCFTALLVLAKVADRTGSEAFTALDCEVLGCGVGGTGGSGAGNADNGSRAAAPVLRFGSSEVPHIPQKRKLGALSSLQFGQITIILQCLLSQFNSDWRRSLAPQFILNRFILKFGRHLLSISKMSTKSTLPARRFQARLERLRSRLNWIVVYLPFDAPKVWGLRGQIKVKGEINGFGFRTSLFPTGEGRHFLLVNKRMQREAGAAEGILASFQLELDVEKRIVKIPSELETIFKQDRSLRRWYAILNPSTRNDITKWITEPQSAEARVRRAEQIAERLLSVMEAEKELPPVLRRAFAQIPSAREGWEAMSVSRRRGHLFGVFYYRTPEGQHRRIDKMLEDASALAEKMRTRKK